MPTIKKFVKSFETAGVDVAGTRAMSWLATWLPVVLVAGLPLFLLPTGSAVDFSKQWWLVMLTALSFLAWFGMEFLRGELKLRWGWAQSAACLWILVAAASSLFSVYPYGSVVGTTHIVSSLFSTSGLVLAFFLIANRAEEQRRWMTALSVSAAVVALWQVLHLFGLRIPLPSLSGNDFSPVGSVNDGVVYLAMMVPLFLYGATQSSRRLTRAVTAVGLVLSLLAIHVSGATNAWIITGVGALSLMVLWAFAFRTLRATVTFGALIVLVIAALSAVQPRPFVRLDIPTEIGLSHRVSLAVAQKSMVEGVRQAFIGSGPSTFSDQFSKYRPVEMNVAVVSQNGVNYDLWAVRFTQASTIWLTLLAVIGIIGTLALLAVVALSFWSGRTLLSSGVGDLGSNAVLLAAALTALVASLLHAFVLTHLFFLVVLLALLLVGTPERRFSLSSLSRSGLGAMVSTTLVLILSLYAVTVQVQRAIAEVATSRAIQLVRQGNVDDAFPLVTSALSHAPQETRYWSVASDIARLRLIRLANQENVDPGALQLALTQTQQSAARARDIAPSAPNIAALATFYQQIAPYFDNAAVVAAGLYEQAGPLDPTNPLLPTEQGRAHILASDQAPRNIGRPAGENVSEADLQAFRNEQLEKAKQAIEKALQLKPNYSPARFLRAGIALRQGRSDEAVAELNALQAQSPRDAALHYERGLLYYQLKRNDEAKAAFTNAVNINTRYANARYFLGIMASQAGDNAEALKQFEEVVALDPSSQEAKVILENVRAGRPALETISPPGPAPEERTDEPLETESE